MKENFKHRPLVHRQQSDDEELERLRLEALKSMKSSAPIPKFLAPKPPVKFSNLITIPLEDVIPEPTANPPKEKAQVEEKPKERSPSPAKVDSTPEQDGCQSSSEKEEEEICLVSEEEDQLVLSAEDSPLNSGDEKELEKGGDSRSSSPVMKEVSPPLPEIDSDEDSDDEDRCWKRCPRGSPSTSHKEREKQPRRPPETTQPPRWKDRSTRSSYTSRVQSSHPQPRKRWNNSARHSSSLKSESSWRTKTSSYHSHRGPY